MDVVVIGAGICGLAAAHELQRRGARVTVLEAEATGAGQSAGLARIFRIAHADPRLCALALESRERWLAWEAELGAGRLLGEEGLVVADAAAASGRATPHRAAATPPGDRAAPDPAATTPAGESAERRAAAMRAAGAPVEPLSSEEIGARLPFFAYGWNGGVWDPLAGSLRIRRALDALAARVTVRRAVVSDLDAIDADAILVCAGLGTQALAPELDFGMTHEPHVRVTYDAGIGAPCVISPELYGLPIGSTGRYAIGMHDQDDVPAMRPLRAVGRVECVSLHAPWLDEHGDGFLALRAGRVTAFTGSNVMKFGPLIGDRLARSVLDGEVHGDLAGPEQDGAGRDAR
jgi:glycine/D-amino acid oxidase-like deaminating enzyme